MIIINLNLLSGTGSPPKDLGLNSFVSLVMSSDVAGIYEWELLLAPKDSNAYLSIINQQSTKIGPLDKMGAYQIRAWINRGLPSQQYRMISLSVPKTHIKYSPALPNFDSPTGSKVRNANFELPGVLPGYALYWDVVDDASILSSGGGVTRGRIISPNFIATQIFCMCLGDDQNVYARLLPGEIFGISQDVDFTNMKNLICGIKFVVP